MFMLAAIGIPVPAISYSACAIAHWFDLGNEPEIATVWGRFLYVLSQIWLWLLLTLVIGIVTGWACRQRETKVFGRLGWYWPILVGLCGWFGWFGWFGWIAYICLHPRPARLPDGQWIKDRPEPNLALGTEIFA